MLCGHNILFLPDKQMSSSAIVGLMLIAHLGFLRNCQTELPERLYHFTFPPAMYEWPSFSVSSLALSVVNIFYLNLSYRCVVIVHHGFIWHFSNKWDYTTFGVLICHWCIPFSVVLVLVFRPFKKSYYSFIFSYNNLYINYFILEQFWIHEKKRQILQRNFQIPHTHFSSLLVSFISMVHLPQFMSKFYTLLLSPHFIKISLAYTWCVFFCSRIWSRISHLNLCLLMHLLSVTISHTLLIFDDFDSFKEYWSSIL